MPSARLKTLIVCVAVTAVPVHAAAASGRCAMTYETFEHAVPHIDLEECPDPALSESAFCRVSAGGEQFHLFYFDSEGDHCLLDVKSFEEDNYSFALKPQ
jgi:hypothetical protein